MGDPKAPSAYKSTAGTLQAFSQYYPEALSALLAGVIPSELVNVQAQEAAAPRLAALQNQVAGQYGGEAARIASANELSALTGPGTQLVQAAQGLQRSVDPEYYALRSQVSNAMGNLLGSYNLGGLSGGERAEVERSLNADALNRGTLTAPSNTETVGRALNFGQGLVAKQQGLANALNVAAGVTPGLISGFDATQTALGRPSSNTFQGVQPLTNAAGETGNNFLNNVFGLQQQRNQINAERRSAHDVAIQSAAAHPNVSVG